MTPPPPIEAVIPAHYAAGTLPACLEGLRHAGFAPGHVVVVDDDSGDATPDIAREAGARLCRSSARIGAAAARNLGVRATTAPIVLFVDADVALHAGVRQRILDFFATHPGYAALIGSYDADPPAPGGLSRIRNLLHHHVHQRAGGDVASFWTGCGAIRRRAFDAVGGFEPGHPLEDVALGLDLARAGQPVRLDPGLLCTHLKRWRLHSMLRADLFYRALPWSRMLLDPSTEAPAELNAGRSGRIAVALSAAAAAACLAAFAVPAALVPAGLALGLLAFHDRGFLALVRDRLGAGAAGQALAVLWLHYLCAGAGFALALAERVVIQRGACR